MTLTDTPIETKTEAIQATIVEHEPVPVPVEQDTRDRANAAIERASDTAIAMPGVPGRDEFLALAMQARMLSLSGAAPKLVRNNAYIAFHVAMVGRDLGISPSAALELIDVMDTGGQIRLSLSPQLLNGQIRRLRLGKIIPIEQTNERCVAQAVGPDGEILGNTEFTWEDARIAGLVGRECKPGEHKQSTRTRKDGTSYNACGCNQGYITYPKRMLWWRASGFCADDYFPEAGLGLYTAEELGAVVDADGRPIDPATVDLPDGYVDPGMDAAARKGGWQSYKDFLDHRDRLQGVLDLLDDETRAKYNRWAQRNSLFGMWEPLDEGPKAAWEKAYAKAVEKTEPGHTATADPIGGPTVAEPVLTPGAPPSDDDLDGVDSTGEADDHDHLGYEPPEDPKARAERRAKAALAEAEAIARGPGRDLTADELAAFRTLATVDIVDEVTPLVKALSLAKVDADLTALGVIRTGQAQDRRLRLSTVRCLQRLNVWPGGATREAATDGG